MNKENLLRRADEFEDLAHCFLEHARHLREHSSTAGQQPISWPENTGNLGATAEAMLAARKQRLRHLEGALLGEPAWDMLLFIFQAVSPGFGLTVGQICQSSGTFPSAARRWLAVLVDQALVEIREDGESDLLKSVQLTEIGRMKVTKILISQQDEFLQRGWSASGMA